jgi:WD40 repeat protein/serine/threonine protein kinase
MTEREIFLGALDKENPNERAAYLDKVCAGDAELRQRIEELLQCHQHDDTFLEISAVRQIAGDDGALASLAPGREPDVLGRLDHYDVLEVIGRGATGVVLKARDTKLQRIIAIKMLAPRLAASTAARARFVREAQAAAAVRNDNVVAIHAVSDEGRAPYLVMEYIHGTTLEARVKEVGPLELKETLRVGMQVATGLAAAHAQGVVHRDVKPANVLLENGVQRVKLTDFGLAWVGEDGGEKATGFLAGTPLYMSPEQARGELTDYRTDLFSLGSLLYTLCTGKPPFQGDTTADLLKRVREDIPTQVSKINPNVPEWLCQAIAKLHAKKPHERSASAQEVAELLSGQLARLQQPHLPEHVTKVELTSAGPESRVSWPRKPQSGQRGLIIACLAALALAVIAACAYLAWRQLRAADNQEDDESILPSGPLELRREAIPSSLLTLAGGGDPVQSPPELVSVLGDGRFLLPRLGGTSWMSQSPDGKVLAVPLDDNVVLFEAASGNYIREIKGPGGRVVWVTFSPDSRLLAATTWYEGNGGFVRVWDQRAPQELFTKPVPGPKVSGAAVFSADGKRLYAEGQERIHVWDTQSGQELQSKEVRSGGIGALCVSSDGRRLAAALFHAKRAEIFEWDGDKLVEVRALPVHQHAVEAVAFSSDNKYLASGTQGGFKLWNAETFEEVRSVETPAGQLAFSPDSRVLYVGSTNRKPKAVHTITRWAVDSRKELPALSLEIAVDPGYAHHHLSRDGKLCFFSRGGLATCIQAMDTTSGKPLYPRQGHTAPVHAVAISPDGRTLASGSEDQTVKIWELSTGQVRFSSPTGDRVVGLAFSPDGKLLASASAAGIVSLRDARRGTHIRVFQGHSRSPSRIQFSADSRNLATGSDGGVVQMWDVATGQSATIAGHTGIVRSLALSQDDKVLASGGEDGTILLHDLTTGSSRKFTTLQSVNDVALSADGHTLASIGDTPGDTVRLRNLEDGKETILKGHIGNIHKLSFSPSAPLLATCGEDGKVRLWDTTRPGEAPARVIGPGPFGGPVRSVAFTPDGRYLATANANGMVYLLRIESVR